MFDILDIIPVKLLIYVVPVVVVVIAVVMLCTHWAKYKGLLKDTIDEILNDETIVNEELILKVVSNFILYLEKRLSSTDKSIKGSKFVLSVLKSKFMNKLLIKYVTDTVHKHTKKIILRITGKLHIYIG